MFSMKPLDRNLFRVYEGINIFQIYLVIFTDVCRCIFYGWSGRTRNKHLQDVEVEEKKRSPL